MAYVRLALLGLGGAQLTNLVHYRESLDEAL
jgi:hypothetical protein